jgi:hypothetical protein
MSLICLILCGFISGVGIGILLIDNQNLEIIMQNGSEIEK